MDVSKAPPPPDPANAAGVKPSAGAKPTEPANTQGAAPATVLQTADDRVDIHPLDVMAALQILVAEVRAELPALLMSNADPVEAPPDRRPPPPIGLLPLPTDSRLATPAHAAPALIRLFLQEVPEEAANPAIWVKAVTQLEAALQTALDRGVSAVEQWRDVTSLVADAARDTRSVVMGQLEDGPPHVLWPLPEWLGLAPHIERYRRRRRLARRYLTDPDSWRQLEEEARDEASQPRFDHGDV